MGKKYKKNKEQDILNSKAIEFSNIVEQSLEDILNELIGNNYKQSNNSFDNIFKNKSAANKLCDEINELAQNILASSKDKNLLPLKSLLHRENSYCKFFANEITRIMKFVNHLKDINNTVELIKININELYKYPAFKKQAYIPEFSLALSAFFKENIDLFFTRPGSDEIIKNKVASELSRIISLGNKIMNEFFLNITSENNGNIKDSGNQVIYYSNIISLLELISINSLEFTFI
ncbi:MAG: hypothetical protein ACYDDB_04465 [bacterium]